VRRAANQAPTLSPRQAECLRWVSEGETSGEIGRRLALSPRTVEQHIWEACERLDARTRAQAVARALALGLL
jgi:DNA-binding CsgD family transcriptional regulator